MANSALSDKRYTLATSLLLLFFLLTIFLFTRRTLEPYLSSYRDPFPHNNLHVASLDSTNLSNSQGFDPSPIYQNESAESQTPAESIDKNSPVHSDNPEPSDSSILVSQPERREFGTDAESIKGDVSGENGKDPVRDSERIDEKGGDKLMQSVRECDLYEGTWVKDEGYPIYGPGSCPYVDEAFDCQNNGRRDSDYLKWRWKPDACDLPR